MTGTRKYELKKRAVQVEETRRRITEATVELHRTVGPAATQISEIARRAGVRRVTVYSHFPDEPSLLSACSAHWRALHPAPDPNGWRDTADVAERRRRALRDLYAWYRETEPMTANVLRDAETIPALRSIVDGGLGRYLATVEATLVEPFRSRGRRRERIEAAVRAAVGFHFWRALAPLGDRRAAELGAGLVELAAGTGSTVRRPARSGPRAPLGEAWGISRDARERADATAHELHPDASWSSFELAGFLAGLRELPRTAMDVGCGTGGDAMFLAELGIRTTGLDVSRAALDRARERAESSGVDVTLVEGSALDMPADDASIGLMTDRGCLHHLGPGERGRYASEAARVLRPGGTLLVRDMSHPGHGSSRISADALRAMIRGLPLRLDSIVPFRQGAVTGILAVIRREEGSDHEPSARSTA